MHQIAQWRGREEERGGSLTTRGFLLSWVPFATCASKSRWHVGALGGSVSLNKLPVHIHSTYPVMSLGEGERGSAWNHLLCANRMSLTHAFKHRWHWIYACFTRESATDLPNNKASLCSISLFASWTGCTSSPHPQWALSPVHLFWFLHQYVLRWPG